LSVTSVRSMVFSGYSGFLHQWNWPLRYCKLFAFIRRYGDFNTLNYPSTSWGATLPALNVALWRLRRIVRTLTRPPRGQCCLSCDAGVNELALARHMCSVSLRWVVRLGLPDLGLSFTFPVSWWRHVLP